MVRRLGFLLQALLVAIVIVAIRLSWAPAWAREDPFVVLLCVAVAFFSFLVGLVFTMRCLGTLFERVDDRHA